MDVVASVGHGGAEGAVLDPPAKTAYRDQRRNKDGIPGWKEGQKQRTGTEGGAKTAYRDRKRGRRGMEAACTHTHTHIHT